MTNARLINNPFLKPVALTMLVLMAFAMQTSFAGGHSSSGVAPVERPLVDAQLLQRYLDGDSAVSLIDTRSPEEYAAAHISGAVNVPFDDLDNYTAALPADKSAPVVLYCRTGRRASVLKEQLAARGYSSLHVLPAEQIQRGETQMSILPNPQ